MPTRRMSKSRSKSPRRVRGSSGRKARTSGRVTQRRSHKRRTYKGVDSRVYGVVIDKEYMAKHMRNLEAMPPSFIPDYAKMARKEIGDANLTREFAHFSDKEIYAAWLSSDFTILREINELTKTVERNDTEIDRLTPIYEGIEPLESKRTQLKQELDVLDEEIDKLKRETSELQPLKIQRSQAQERLDEKKGVLDRMRR